MVRVNRDQHYVYIYCSKNPRHKQRTKFLTLTTQAGEHACCPGHHSDPLHGSYAEDAVGIPCLPEPSLGIMQQHMLSAANRGLLGSRHTSVLGESFWRATMLRQQDL